jgi:hypothetical protein
LLWLARILFFNSYPSLSLRTPFCIFICHSLSQTPSPSPAGPPLLLPRG